MVACIAALAAGSASCGLVKEKAPELVSDTRSEILGTVITVSSYEKMNEDIFDGVFDVIADIDNRMTMHTTNSEIARVNAASGNEAVAVSADTYELIGWAKEFSEASSGAFDISIGAVTELWKKDSEFAVLPQTAEIDAALPLVDYEQVELTDEKVFLKQPGMMIDLGGIAKGYACDQAVAYLQGQGISSGLLDFGGNIYAHGAKPDDSSWQIGIKSPITGESGNVCAVGVRDKAVVTSGGYERYFEENGVVYHHILDPRTGYPAKSEILSVTILDKSSTRADALTTACFVMGLEKGMALLEKMPESEGIFITKDYKIYTSAGLAEQVKITDSRFELLDYDSVGTKN